MFCTNPVRFLWYSWLLLILEQEVPLHRCGSNTENKMIDFAVWNVRTASPKNKTDQMFRETSKLRGP